MMVTIAIDNHHCHMEYHDFAASDCNDYNMLDKMYWDAFGTTTTLN